MKKIILNISLAILIPIMMIGCDGITEPVPFIQLEGSVGLNYEMQNFSDSLKVGDTVHITLNIPNRFDGIMGDTFYRITDNNQTYNERNRCSTTMIPQIGFWVNHLDTSGWRFVNDFVVAGGNRVPFWTSGSCISGSWLSGKYTVDFVPSKSGIYSFNTGSAAFAIPVRRNNISYGLPVQITFNSINDKLTNEICEKDSLFKINRDNVKSSRGELKAFYVK